MSQSIGNTTYHKLNVNMLKGTQDVGKTAKEVDTAYKSSTASTAKRVLLGILTLGIYSIVHAVKDSGHASDLRKLSQGTEEFYKKLSDLVAKGNSGEEASVKAKMCGEEVELSRDVHGKFWAKFKDGSPEEIKNPRDVLHNIEKDVMEHSELFEKSIVVDTILGKYEERIAKGVDGYEGTGQQILDLEKEEAPQGIFGIYNMAQKAKEARPQLAMAKERYDELLATLFTARLGITQAETQYIDRSLGTQLAANIMNGTLATAADARAFINRNSSETHFGTVESARIFSQFEEAQALEESSFRTNKISVKTDSVQFKDGYYQPKPNPVLPQGEDKAVHDFVANLISDSNIGMHDKDRTHDGISGGARLRTLFQENSTLVGQMMKNRAETLADPSKKSMLATLEPGIRKALEEQLDKINAKFDAELAQRKKALDDTKRTVEKAIANKEDENGYLGECRKRFETAERSYNFYADPEKGRANYLARTLSEQSRQEKKLRVALGTANINDVHEIELDAIGATKQAQKNEDLKDFVGDDKFLGNKKEEIGLGLNFFGDMEKRLDENFSQGCKDLQAKIKSMIDNVFPPAPQNVQKSVQDIQNSTLPQLIGTAAEDSQMQLIKAALEEYFEKMPPMDQRAMLAAGTRFCAHGDNVSDGAKLGAILKGAGPVMQKMLQGLDPSMFKGKPDFQLALGDMKDKLAPISQDVIHAYLFDVVKNSNGQIKKIEVNKALGAASVAQALKCTITKADGSTTDCVIKVLRPDVAMRAQREKAVFEDAAKKVGNGMELTFQGQFEGIEQELDLRNEAKNVQRGNEVYDYSKIAYNKQDVTNKYGSFSNVHSMKLVDGVAPNSNIMVLEQVQGNTLENYIKDAGEESRKIAQDTKKEIESRGPNNAPDVALNGAKQLERLYDDVKSKYESLVNLAYMWTNEGLFADGFYHGDIHKGNIMTDYSWKQSPEEAANDPNKGITLIDFGNASSLNKSGRADVVKVVAGTATKDAPLFIEGFKSLLSADSRNKFDAAGQELKDKLTAVFEKGTLQDTGARLSAALKLMQREYQIEVPGEIHNFLESQRRLQVCMDETLSTMKAIANERKELLTPYLEQLPAEEKSLMENSISQADNYKPVSMMKCIKDVVKQNLFAAMKSIGGARKAKQCYDKIKSEVQNEQQQPVQDNNPMLDNNLIRA